MKERRINLLAYKEDRHRVLRIFRNLRIAIFVYSLLLVIYLVSFFAINLRYQDHARALSEERAAILSAASAQVNKEDFAYLAKKVQFIQSKVSTEINPIPYYNRISQTLTISTQSARIKAFSMNSDREAEFRISLPDFSATLNFLQNLESGDLITQFEDLDLVAFSSISPNDPFGASGESAYELSFSGKFKKQ